MGQVNEARDGGHVYDWGCHGTVRPRPTQTGACTVGLEGTRDRGNAAVCEWGGGGAGSQSSGGGRTQVVVLSGACPLLSPESQGQDGKGLPASRVRLIPYVIRKTRCGDGRQNSQDSED